MKRLHIHIDVTNLKDSINFYQALFGAAPIKIKDDYAKWLLDEPGLNFAISTRSGKSGLNHLGINVDQEDELDDMRARFKQADLTAYDEGETMCCYARSDKSWLKDPAGIGWETYRNMADVAFFSKDVGPQATCCAEESTATQKCC
jgi:catechol-2,3-dioxygenase